MACNSALPLHTPCPSLFSASFPLTIILTHLAFTSLLFSFRTGKWQPKWQIGTNVTQVSFAFDKQENGEKKSASATEKLLKRKFERVHIVQRKISTLAISEIVFYY